MDIEKRKSFIINFLYCFIIGGIIFIVLKYGLPFIGPFVIAFVIAFLLSKPITFLSEKCHVNRAFVAIMIVILFYGTVGILFSIMGIRLFISAKEWFFYLPNLYTLEIIPPIIKQ